MLDLKDISLYYSNVYINQHVRNCIDVNKIVDELIAIGITNYQQLKDYVNNCNNQKEIEQLSLILKDVERKKERFIKNQKIFKIYSFPVHENIRLIKNDLVNNCSTLILNNPMSETRSCEYLDLKKQSIDYVKHAISHVDLSGKNTLCNISKMGNSYLDKIYSAIQLYDVQVLRQYEENIDKDVENIFLVNQMEKRKLVLEQYKEIVEYLLENSNYHTFVWGELTPRKQILMEKTLISKSKNALMRTENLVNIITNYTTLSELKSDIVKTKTLDRFIVR